jgi:hypothetical protein
MLPDPPMTDLSARYDQVARTWTHDELGERYRQARSRGRELPGCEHDHLVRRPIALLANAVSNCATLSVAIHVIHVVPAAGDPGLVDRLFDSAEKNSAIALHRGHQALALDGRAHDYTADEWLPAIYDMAASLLETAHLDHEPPSLVEQAEDVVRWLSRAIADLDDDAPDAAAGIVDGLGRLLSLHVFSDVASNRD